MTILHCKYELYYRLESNDVNETVREQSSCYSFRVFESLVAVAEDTAIGANITQVVAIDADQEQVNSAVQYRILSGTLNKVEIDRLTVSFPHLYSFSGQLEAHNNHMNTFLYLGSD